jgi:hypothetical protein
MVYSTDILNTNLTQDKNTFQVQSPTPTPCNCPQGAYNRTTAPVVGIYWNCCGIHTITGPTPAVDFSTTITRMENGMPTVATTKITLVGKIVRGLNEPPGYGPYGSGIQPVMSGINDLQAIFRKDTCGQLDIICASQNGGAGGTNASKLYSASGVRLIDISFNKSDDNWIYTADYTINLEFLEPMITGWYIKEYTDSWSIESLEDYYYTDFLLSGQQKKEWDNPNIKPATSLSTVPPSEYSFRINNVPRFKLSHTVSAVGLPRNINGLPGYCDVTDKTDPKVYSNMEMNAFLSAKDFVEKRAGVVSGVSSTTAGAVWSPLDGGFLYNHIRSTRYEMHSSSYEITDSFLAMPTGITFLEDYNIDISTDDKYIHTVRIQGEIQGLSIVDSKLFSNPTVTGVSVTSPSGYALKILPSGISAEGLSATNFSHTLSDANPATNSSINELSKNKYSNALSGWIYDVKPYLYRRASVLMSNWADRTKGYNPAVNRTPPLPPNNPIYSRHVLLNIIPISTTEGHNTRQGKITYGYEFNNKFTIISGVIYENITIDDTGPADVIAEAFVIGRSLGPVLQDLGTKTSAKKSVTIEVGVVPPTSVNGFFLNNSECPLFTGGSVFTTISGIVEGLKPFGDRASSIFGNTSRIPATNMPGLAFVNQDNYNWDPSNGKFTRQVGWTYQPCNNNRSFLDT